MKLISFHYSIQKKIGKHKVADVSAKTSGETTFWIAVDKSSYLSSN